MNAERVGKFSLAESEKVCQIHDASLAILERTGVLVEHRASLERLHDNGAIVDFDSCQVKLPAELVMAQVGRAGRRVVLGGRTPDRDIVLGEQSSPRPASRPVTGPDDIYDETTGKRQRLSSEDLRQWTLITDWLDQYDYQGVVFTGDMEPLASRDVAATAFMARHTTKHLHTDPHSAQSIHWLVEIAAIITGGRDQVRRRPLVSFPQVSISPLYLPSEVTERLLAAGYHGLPVFLNSSPLMGATAPVSMAGCVALANAELLAMNTILQLSYPGTPVVYQVRQGTFEMKTTQGCWGVIEGALAAVALIQLARSRYGFPTDAYGPSTESKLVDVQSGMERTWMSVLPVLAGTDILAGGGNIDSMACVSLDQLIVDAELFETMKRTASGMKIDADELAVDVVNAVGPRGHFLESGHTFKRHRDAFQATLVFDRQFRDVWQQQGSTTVAQKAHELREQIVAEHAAPPLTDTQQEQIDEVLREAAAKAYRPGTGGKGDQ